jgi:hypothetical protein
MFVLQPVLSGRIIKPFFFTDLEDCDHLLIIQSSWYTNTYGLAALP